MTPKPEAAEEKEQRHHPQVEPASLHRHAEEETAGGKDGGGGDQPDEEVGDRLSDDQLQGVHGRDTDLFHGPSLLLPHDGEGGGDHRRHHQDEHDEAGHEEIGAAQLGVEKDAGPEVDRGLHSRHARTLQGAHECPLGIVRGNRLDVADGGCRGVRVGTVGDGLHLDLSAVRDIPAEVHGNHQGHQDISLVQEAVDL